MPLKPKVIYAKLDRTLQPRVGPSRGCFFKIKPVGRNWGNWISVPATDLAALASIFNEKPVYLHPNGTISTGEEPIGQ
jgi:hypothetical protein